jgi:hypothetical protein
MDGGKEGTRESELLILSEAKDLPNELQETAE